MSWISGEIILNKNTERELNRAKRLIRRDVRNNGDTEAFPNLGEDLLPIVQRKMICKSYEDAKELADSLIWRREYNLLIPFKDVDSIKETKKIQNLKERIRKEETKLNEYIKKTDCKNYKSKYIGCPQCGSKINKEYIYNCRCPLCRKDLRSDTTKNTINRYKENIKRITIDLRIEKEKSSNKANTKYLLLFEEYCG